MGKKTMLLSRAELADYRRRAEVQGNLPLKMVRRLLDEAELLAPLIEAARRVRRCDDAENREFDRLAADECDGDKDSRAAEAAAAEAWDEYARAQDRLFGSPYDLLRALEGQEGAPRE